MMTWGFRSKAVPGGQVQIDSEYLNLSFRNKFTVSSISAGSFYTMANFAASGDTNMIYYVVDFPGDRSVIAVKNSSGRAIGYNHFINETSSSNPPPAGYKRQIFYQSGTVADTLTVYLYDEILSSDMVGLTGWGMRITKAGKVIYHSALPVLRLKNLVNLQRTTVGSVVTTPSSQTSAFLFSNLTGGRYYPAGTNRVRLAGVQQISSTSITVVELLNYDTFAAVNPSPVDYTHCTMLVVDVTNL